MYELMETKVKNEVIKVIGVGGGGSNAVQHMLSANITEVDFISYKRSKSSADIYVESCFSPKNKIPKRSRGR